MSVSAHAIGRNGNMSTVEAEQFVLASQELPGGALGGKALANGVRFIVSHGKGPRSHHTRDVTLREDAWRIRSPPQNRYRAALGGMKPLLKSACRTQR